MKKHSFITILLTMLMSMTGAKALAYDFEAKNEDGVTIYYRYINDGTELEVVYKSILVRYGGDIVIPEEVTYMGRTRKVTSIGSETFSRSNVRSVIIPNSVTSIGDHAFQHCLGLQSLSIPDNVTFIGEGAFSGCQNISTMIIPNGVTSIKANTFSGCSRLSYVLIPQSVTTIEHHAFSKCISLLTGSIPEGVTSIGNGAFSGCVNLGSVVIPSSVTSIGQKAFDQVDLMDVYSEINDPFEISPNTFNINTLNNGTLNVPKGTKDKYRATPGWNNFKYIEDGTEDPGDNEDASYKCGQDAYYIYDDATSTLTIYGSGAMNNYYIDDYAPWYSYANEIKNIEISPYITTIGDFAFYKCSNITNITLPFALTSIGSSGFEECSSLTSLTLNEGLETIKGSAFESCTGLKSITLPSTISTILLNAFKNCTGLTDMYCYAESVPNTDDSAFDGTPTEASTLHVPTSAVEAYKGKWPWSTFKEIVDESTINGTCGENVSYSYDKATHTLTISGEGEMTFYYDRERPWYSFAKEIEKVIIEDGVTSVGAWAFIRCSALSSVDIAESVKTIYNETFRECTNLTSIDIPEGLKEIGSSVFDGCTSLASVNIPNSVISIGGLAFHDTPWLNSQEDGLVYINKVLYMYKGEMPDNTNITIDQGTVFISGNAFQNCNGLTSISIPGSVTTIGGEAFSGCKGLTSVKISEGVTAIWYDAFEYCTNLTSVTIPSTVTSIGNHAFQDCKGLTSVNISEGVTSIGEYTFMGCSGLTSFVIPNSVTSVGSCAIAKCSGLTSVVIGKNVTTFGDDVFYESTCITSVISLVEKPFELSNFLGYTFSPKTLSEGTLFVPAGTKALYQATAGWDQFQNIVEADEEIIDPTPEKETLIAVQNWEGNTGDYPLWFWAGVEKTDGTSVSLEAEGLAINNSRSQEKMWIPQAIVLGRMPTIEKGHDYIVRLTVKVPADGTYYVFLGSWDGFYDEYDVPVKTSERFQVIDIKFPNYVNTIAEGTGFVLLRSGLVVGTTIIKKVEVYDLTDSKDDSYVDGIHYKFDVESLTAEVLPTSQKYEGDIVIPTAVMNDGKVYTVTRIGNIAFMNCKDIISVTIPNTVETIGMNAFEGCTNLRVIRIGKGVKEIGGGAFSGISGNPGTRAEGKGIDVYCYSETVPKTATDAFKGTSLEASTLHVPATAVEAYKATWPWSDFKDIVAIEEDPDGIMGVRKSADGSGDYYDLTGRKALKLRKGLYIRNGKKVVIK